MTEGESQQASSNSKQITGECSKKESYHCIFLTVIWYFQYEVISIVLGYNCLE